jgi:putative ABC transport system substrate-binding protein
MMLREGHPTRTVRARKTRWRAVRAAAIGLLAALAAAWPTPSPASEPAQKTVCILFSRDLPPYRQAVEGLKAELDRHGKHRYVELMMTGSATDDLEKRISQAKPDVVVTLGTEASKVAVASVEDVPVVFAMVANPVDSGILPRRPSADQAVAGVTTDVAPAEQFALLRQVVPKAKRIAVIYCPQYTEATVAGGEKAAKAAGMELLRFPVEPYRVDAALENLARESVDAMWTVTDPGVMVPATAKRILTYALKAKVPVIGFSPAMVRAGALLGFEIDPKALGAQAAGIVAGLLYEGKKPADFHVVYPEGPVLYLNAAVAQRIGVKLPEAVVAKAQVVQAE